MIGDCSAGVRHEEGGSEEEKHGPGSCEREICL